MSQAGTPSVISTYAKQLQDQDEKGSLLALLGLDTLASPLADGGAEMRYAPFA
jgi:hypothetical protein